MSLSKAAWISERGLFAGLVLLVSFPTVFLNGVLCVFLMGLHVYKGLRVGKGMSQLDFAEDVAMAVYGRVARGDDRAIDEESICYLYINGESCRQEGGYEGSKRRHFELVPSSNLSSRRSWHKTTDAGLRGTTRGYLYDDGILYLSYK